MATRTGSGNATATIAPTAEEPSLCARLITIRQRLQNALNAATAVENAVRVQPPGACKGETPNPDTLLPVLADVERLADNLDQVTTSVAQAIGV